MASILKTFILAGAQSLAAAGATSITHGLPTTPDVALWIPTGAISLPVSLDSRGATVLVLRNPNGAQGGEIFAAVFHSLIR